MSCTVGGVTPFPPMWAYGLAANQAFRKSKMSCGEIVPEPLKSAWQQGVVWLPAELHAAAFAANRAPIPVAGGVQSVCAMLVEHVDPRQQTPDGGQVLLGAHAVFGPRQVPLNRVHRFRFSAAQLVVLQHAPIGTGHATTTHVVAFP